MRARPRRRTGRLLLVGAGTVVALAVVGCGDRSGSTTTTGQSGRSGTTTVLAASSLSDVLPDLVAGFRRLRPDVTVETSTGASSALVEQVRAGVDADVVLTADRVTAEAAADASAEDAAAAGGPGAPAPEPFATNTLVLAVPAGNPGNVRTLAALSEPELLVGLCTPQVPCGTYARRLLEVAGVEASADTEEPDARSLMVKIASGDLDAGLVYRTDVLAAGPAALAVDVPEASQVPVTYFAVRLGAGAGAEFVDYLLGPGRKVLAAAGFGLP